MEAYCVKCKTKREMTEAKAEYTATGTSGTRGKCPVCGTTLYRMGATPEHANLPKPEIVAAPKRVRKNGKTESHSRRVGKLVIVESPTKAKTVGRFLGKGYTVEASIGHVRDLLRSTLSVDVEHDFVPKYRVPNEKKETVKKLAALADRAEAIYLATDPDREGEAIAWHLLESAGIDRARAHRVVFHEITPSAIHDAFSQPRDIDMQLVNAQQARRILDRLVGYELSPLLWRKIRGRLSAGRVQSVALRLIVERERDAQAFVPVEYWSIGAELAKQVRGHHKHEPKKRQTFTAKLIKVNGQEIDLKNEPDTQAIVVELEKATYQVANVKQGERRRRPSPPFTTSTLQQEANRKLSFPARRTMGLAQSLYEGVTLGDEGSIGLITYMRTDSTNVAESAQHEARSFIRDRFGAEFLPDESPIYKTRAKNAQEAHEAIRPTSVARTPESIKAYLDPAQYKLYDLIWKRFVASQMNPAIFDTVSVDVAAGETKVVTELVPLNGTAIYPYLFRATGSTLQFPGYLAVYEEAREEDVKQEGDDDVRIPPLTAQELLDLMKLLPEQHFTEPPPRYTEASLVKALEEYGIGRPSTYASILSVIDRRGYVEKADKRLRPTEIGFTVNDMLVEYFGDVVNVDFTAQMEEELDEIAEGTKEWVPVIREFYEPFQRDIEHADANIEKVDLVEELGEPCPLCGKPLLIRYGRYGKFIGCSDFPTCRYTAPILVKTGVTCPQCGTGDIIEKKTKRGRLFYGCSNYKNGDPDSCDFTSWNRPLPQPCPSCGGLLTVKGKDGAKCIKCENEFSTSVLPEAQLAAG